MVQLFNQSRLPLVALLLVRVCWRSAGMADRTVIVSNCAAILTAVTLKDVMAVVGPVESIEGEECVLSRRASCLLHEARHDLTCARAVRLMFWLFYLPQRGV